MVIVGMFLKSKTRSGRRNQTPALYLEHWPESREFHSPQCKCKPQTDEGFTSLHHSHKLFSVILRIQWVLFRKTWEDLTQFAGHENHHKQVVSFSRSNTRKIKCHSRNTQLPLRPYNLLAAQAMYSECWDRIIKPLRLGEAYKIIHSSH